MLYVLFDLSCGLCRRSAQWLSMQPTYEAITCIPAGSARAKELFPALGHPVIPEELVVVADDGAVFRDNEAWLTALWALRDYRALALRLATPALLPFARRVYHAISE